MQFRPLPRPIRIVLRWQLIATAGLTLAAAIPWGMNGASLPIAFGGPLRLRIPRQLGYKSVKFINRLVVTDSLEGFGSGTGQSVANDGYAWYAGI